MFRLPVFLLFALFILTAAASGKDEYLVMVTEEWPPFRINDASSPNGFRGIDIDIVTALEQELGVPIEVQRHPWARALEMMRDGNADMITGAAWTAEREVFMQYVPVSYYAVRPVFYTQPGKGHTVRSYQDLYGKSIGYSLHSAYFEPFNSDEKLQKVGLSNETQLLQVLALKRLDLIIGTEPNISYERRRLQLVEKTEPTDFLPDRKTELFITLSRKSGAATTYGDALESIMRKMMDDGTVESILNKYR
ncbi:MAG: transporter substrate-binding domain-containing protein [Desulfopila sp.]|jgi:polar amino acid transport system substrate-binding protein|nr:transporter substrate-binding domain-containing protein [Desulfopila sp.]